MPTYKCMLVGLWLHVHMCLASFYQKPLCTKITRKLSCLKFFPSTLLCQTQNLWPFEKHNQITPSDMPQVLKQFRAIVGQHDTPNIYNDCIIQVHAFWFTILCRHVLGKVFLEIPITWNFHLCPNGEISQSSLSSPVVHKA